MLFLENGIDNGNLIAFMVTHYTAKLLAKAKPFASGIALNTSTKFEYVVDVFRMKGAPRFSLQYQCPHQI